MTFKKRIAALFNLRVRLILLFSIVIVPAFLFMLVNANVQRKSSIEKAKSDILRVAHDMSLDQARSFEITRHHLETLAQAPEIRSGNPAVCDPFLENILKEFPAFTNFGVIDLEGNVLCSGLPTARPLNLSDRRYFQLTVKNRRFSIGEYQIGRISGKPSINAGFPIFDASGNLQFVLFAAMDQSWLQTLATEAKLPPEYGILLTDIQGTVLAREPDQEHWIGKILPDPAFLETLQEAVRLQTVENVFETRGPGGGRRLTAYHAIPGLPQEAGIYVSVCIPRELAYAGVDVLIRQNLFGLGAFAILALLALYLGWDVLIANKIIPLLRATKFMAEGDLTQRVQTSDDEIGRLGASFNAMAEQLESSSRELRRSEIKFRRLFESSQIGILVLDAETGAITELNPFAETLLEYPTEELQGKKLWDICPPDENKKNKTVFEELKKQKSIREESLSLRTKSGKAILTDFVGNVYKMNGATLIQCSIRDITERKRAEDALRASEEKFRSVAENAQSLIMLIDREAKITYINRILAGLDPSKAIGSSMEEYFPAEERKRQREIIRKVFEENVAVGFETRGIGPSGTASWYEVNIGPIAQNGIVDKAVIVATDITKLKDVQRSLTESRESVRIVTSSMPIVLFSVDANGIFTLLEGKGLEKLGIVSGKSIGQSAFKQPHNSPIVPDDLRKALQGENLTSNVDVNGSTFETNVAPLRGADGKPNGAVGIAIDITQRIKIEKTLAAERKTLEEAKAKDEAILSSIGEGLIATDADGKIVIMNETAERLLGCKKKEMIGKNFYTMTKLEDEEGREMPMAKRPVYLAIATGKTHSILMYAETYYFSCADGHHKFPSLNIAAPVILNGKIVGMVLTFRDITSEKAVDRTKNEFISVASHQLRTPLSTANWYTEMLRSGDAGKLKKNQTKFLEEIYRANLRSVALINALLRVSRIDLGMFRIEPIPTNIHEIIDKAWKENVARAQSKRLRFSASIDEGLPVSVSIDPDILNIVLQNLLSNAVKYTPARGNIKLAITKMDSDLLIYVQDTGFGIPKDARAKVFTKFFRADNAKEIDPDGSGLGLYIAKSLIEKSGGRIWFESNEKKGTTFFFTIPLKGMRKREGVVRLT